MAKAKANSAFMKPMKISEALAAVVGKAMESFRELLEEALPPNKSEKGEWLRVNREYASQLLSKLKP